MVELGDLREGIMPADLHDAVRTVLGLPGLVLAGIGTNLACQNGIIPDEANMAELTALTTSVEAEFGITVAVVSGGNSANLPWALAPGVAIGRVNHLRLGESLLLGREPVGRSVVEGLDAHAFSLVGEVIESQWKPSVPRGSRGRTAFGLPVDRPGEGAEEHRVIVALGRQDLDVDGIVAPDGVQVLGASSDHLVLRTAGARPAVGAELRFGIDYGALLQAMTSPSVGRRYIRP
jgi:predicted amino acid racemase